MTGLVIGSRYICGLGDVERSRIVLFLFPLHCGRGGCIRMRECWLVHAAHSQYAIPVLPIVTQCSVYFWRPPLVRHLALAACSLKDPNSEFTLELFSITTQP